MRKLLVVLAVVPTVLLGLPASVSAGGEANPLDDIPAAFTSSPLSGTVGTRISFSGTGCPAGNGVFVGLYSGTPPVPPLATPSADPVVFEELEPNGTWSGSFVVPAGTPTGAFFVFADCFPPDDVFDEGLDAASHDGVVGLGDYLPNVFLLLGLPTGGGGGATPAPTTPVPGLVGDLGAAIPVDGVPRFTG